jgi:aspartate/methionine/tyrosine aminotransferase
LVVKEIIQYIDSVVETLKSKSWEIKSYLDYGSFSPLQMVSASALSEKSDDYLINLRQLYKKRASFILA